MGFSDPKIQTAVNILWNQSLKIVLIGVALTDVDDAHLIATMFAHSGDPDRSPTGTKASISSRRHGHGNAFQVNDVRTKL